MLDQVPMFRPPEPSLYEESGSVPTDHTETEPAAPTNPPPMLTAYVWMRFRVNALRSISALALTVELLSR